MVALKEGTSRACFALFVIILLSGFFPYVAQGFEPQTNESTQRQFSGDIFSVEVLVFLAEHYELWDLNIHNEVIVNVTLNLAEPSTTSYAIYVPTWFSLTKVSNLPPGANYTYGFWGVPPIGILTVYIPASVSYLSVKLEGYSSGFSVLWRNTAEVFLWNITSSLVEAPSASSYRLVLVPPVSSRVLRIYSHTYPYLRYEDITVGGQRRIIVSLRRPLLSPIVILNEPEAWETNAIVVMFSAIFLVFAVPYILKFKKDSSTLSKLKGTLRKFSPSKLIAMLVGVLKRFYHVILRFDSSKLLHAYVLCALLMISLSFAVGPDPRLKVYVLSSTPQNAKIISDFVNAEGAVPITIFDEMGEFVLLSDLGAFSAVVVGNFFPPTEHLVKKYIYPALDVIPQIIIVREYAYDGFASELNRRYTDKTVTVNDLNDLASELGKAKKRENVLGLNIAPDLYKKISSFVGLCSFVLVFIGFAFLASKLIETGKKPKIGGIPEGIAFAFLVFFFTQMVYIVCSVLLAMPLGLHTSSPKVTAIGFMGFGGGSRPRMLAGLVGFLFGAYISLKEGPKLNRVGLAAFLVILLFVLVDPLTQGIIFYEFILLYIIGPTFETAFTAWTYVREFLALVGVAFGGWVTPVYAISTGIILYYAGVIPITLFSKLERSTATASLLICAFWVASGGIRVADMMPWKSVASSMPGIMVGLFVSALFWLISFAEKTIKRKIGNVN
jgi:hypothetical protein